MCQHILKKPLCRLFVDGGITKISNMTKSLNQSAQKNILNDLLTSLKVNQTLQDYFPTFDQFLAEKYITYGEDFVKRLELFGCTEVKDDKLVLHKWIKEFASGIGELRLYHVLTMGNAQCGKSLLNTLLMADFLVFVGVNLIWFYPTRSQVYELVPGMFGRVVRSYIKNIEEHFAKNYNKKLELFTKSDRHSNSAFEVRGATAYFRYASTSGKDHTESKAGLAVVGGGASSVSANGLFIDERSQIPPEAVGTLFRRLDAAQLPGGFIREIGTSGSGQGIESVVENLDRHFYPHIICRECKNIIPLDPKGCLLKPNQFESGKYTSRTGRPINWYHKDPEDKIGSAYFACPKCNAEIKDQERLNAHFRCRNTGQTWRNFQKSLPDNLNEALKNRYLVAFHLSPLLRQTKFNLAVKIIKVGAGYENTSPKDWIQQMLGHPSESDTLKITQQMLVDAIALGKYPLNNPIATIAGIDQGRNQDWLVIAQIKLEGFTKLGDTYWYDSNKGKSAIMAIDDAYRKIIFAAPIDRKRIPALLKEYQVDFGFIDNEPDISQAYEICKATCLEMADQKMNILDIVKEIHVYGGSLELPAYGINSEYFKDAVLNSFAGNKVMMFDFDPLDRGYESITRHMTACEKDPLTLKWSRPADHNDDLFFAWMFMEAALHHHIVSKVTLAEQSVAWSRNITEAHIFESGMDYNDYLQF